MFGSNSYLGLTNHPKVKEGAIEAIRKYGTGCGGSRFLNGTLDIHIECEEKIAKFVGKEGALLFATGMQANLGGISALAEGRDDYVLLDKFDHASIIDGARLGMGRVMRFQHNDLSSLESQLSNIGPEKNKLIVVDGVFSMHGDIAPLPGIVELAEQYGAAVMVDDAHGIGVLGNEGRGTGDHFGLTDRVDVIMGTFSKSLATVGGFLAGDAAMIDYLKHTSRALIFSASIAPANVGAVMAALDIIESEPELIQHLWDNTDRMKKGLVAMGYRPRPHGNPDPAGPHRRRSGLFQHVQVAAGKRRFRQSRGQPGHRERTCPSADQPHGHPHLCPDRPGTRTAPAGREKTRRHRRLTL